MSRRTPNPKPLTRAATRTWLSGVPRAPRHALFRNTPRGELHGGCVGVNKGLSLSRVQFLGYAPTAAWWRSEAPTALRARYPCRVLCAVQGAAPDGRRVHALRVMRVFKGLTFEGVRRMLTRVHHKNQRLPGHSMQGSRVTEKNTRSAWLLVRRCIIVMCVYTPIDS